MLKKYKTFLAFDYGQYKIGVAIANSLIKNAQPLGIVCTRNSSERSKKINHLIQLWQPEKIIIGVPLNFGKINSISSCIKNFSKKISSFNSIPIVFIDESYSSLEAQDTIRSSKFIKKGKISEDSIAASIILQRYLDNFF